MNKGELTEVISKNANIHKIEADKVINCFTNTIIATLKKGGRVTIKDFGSFLVTNRAARNGRNPQTGASIKVKATKTAKFLSGKEFKAILSE
jgi:DNA-binding protein HU-beta